MLRCLKAPLSGIPASALTIALADFRVGLRALVATGYRV